MEEKNKSKSFAGVAIILIIGILTIALTCSVIYIVKMSQKLILNKEVDDSIIHENESIEKVKNTFEELVIAALDDYIYGLRNIDKFDDISKANLEQIAYYTIWNENLHDLSDSNVKQKIKKLDLDLEKAEWYNREETRRRGEFIRLKNF